MNILGSFSQYDRIILTFSPIRFFNNEESNADFSVLIISVYIAYLLGHAVMLFLVRLILGIPIGLHQVFLIGEMSSGILDEIP